MFLFVPRPLCALLAVAMMAFGPSRPVSAAEDKADVSKEELEALRRKAAEVDLLQEQLRKAQLELESMKAANAAAAAAAAAKPVAATPAPVSAVAPGGKPAAWVPPIVRQAAANLPPTPPLASLPKLGPDTVISVNDLVTYFETDPVAAAQHFKGKQFAVRGYVTDLHKPMFTSLYDVSLRLPDRNMRVACQFRPPEAFTRVYVTGNGEEMIGHTANSRTVFARVGTEVTVRGYCGGLKDGAVRLAGCEYLVTPAASGTR